MFEKVIGKDTQLGKLLAKVEAQKKISPRMTDEIIDDVVAYKESTKISAVKLGKIIGIGHPTISRWYRDRKLFSQNKNRKKDDVIKPFPFRPINDLKKPDSSKKVIVRKNGCEIETSLADLKDVINILG